MRYYRTNQKFELPPSTKLIIPETIDEFLNMTYTERVLLRQKHPRIYEDFQTRSDRRGKMPWEE